MRRHLSVYAADDIASDAILRQRDATLHAGASALCCHYAARHDAAMLFRRLAPARRHAPLC